GHGAGYDHQVALPRAGTKYLRTEARNIEPRSRRRDHLDRAAREAESHRPNRGLARPVEDVVHRADHEILFELVLQPAQGGPGSEGRSSQLYIQEARAGLGRTAEGGCPT